MKRLEQSAAKTSEVLPKKVKWLQDKAVHFEPKQNRVTTSNGTTIGYDCLLLAAGLSLYYDKVQLIIRGYSEAAISSKICIRINLLGTGSDRGSRNTKQ